MARLRDTPLLILLMALAGAAMLLPAGHAAILRDHALARAFLYAALMVAVLCIMLALALSGRRFRPTARGQLATVAAVYLVLPPLLALPLLPDEGGGLRFGDAWFEMLSALTTTGATLYAPDDLTATVHLWRAFVGWLGGFYSLVVALAVLAPLNLGGMEVVSGRTPGRSQGGAQIVEVAGIRQRMARFALQLLPAYGGLTLLLWLLLIFAGDASLVALCHAMSTLATSGISPVGGLQGGQAGLAGEGLVALFLLFALSRRLLSLGQGQGTRPLTRDAELRTAAVILALVVGLLLMRQWAAAWQLGQGEDLGAALGALWGNLFMALSFLTTSGFESEHWLRTTLWTGLSPAGMVLWGLAIVGGGIATTAGGVKLLRVAGLFRHATQELDLVIHPNAVAGTMGGRQIARGGTYLAWVFFMLFACTIVAVTGLLTLTAEPFESALVLAISALTNTGPLAVQMVEVPAPWTEVDGPGRVILGAAMVVGRLETLAILALLLPEGWKS
jgi:trk system potassium uptake protein TrkH